MEDYKDLNDYEVMYMVEENDEYAKEMMFKKYKPLIEKYARRFYSLNRQCGLEIDDYIQEGYYGVFFAMKNYKDNRDSLFFTYADLCIRCKMRTLYLKHNRIKNKALNESISLFTPIIVEDGKNYLDILSDRNAIVPEIEYERQQKIDIIKNLIFKLPLSEGCILELYYNGFKIKDIASLLNINSRTISQKISKIKKMLVMD